MGARKHNTAEQNKEAKKKLYFAKLNNCPSSPRKMRLVAELIKGKNVELALNILQHTPNYASEKLFKLLKSAIANWQQKNEGVRMEDSHLFVSQVMVDEGRMLKRVQPAPQGRAHRIRKRSNHVTVIIESRVSQEETKVVTK
ncbi:MAG: 50S ribosomal protein L22 [Bacteroidales bacterium]|jgi:large subunit ribosomal protein L22|nr:50S ribosomal protein L22 [Bacteroidales bacterium]MBK7173529.1 50S ribosomal protein L22 [Bacteroidales bacterium]